MFLANACRSSGPCLFKWLGIAETAQSSGTLSEPVMNAIHKSISVCFPIAGAYEKLID